MVREKYNGLVIEANANQLQSEEGWRPVLHIEKHEGNGAAKTEILINGIYRTRGDATNAALAHGRKWIEEGNAIPGQI